MTEVNIVKVTNGYLVKVYKDGYITETLVATSVKDSYAFGSINLATVLDEVFNPRTPVVIEGEI